jgi:hypothetical protein
VHGSQRRTECLSLARELGYARIEPLNARDLDRADEFRIDAGG